MAPSGQQTISLPPSQLVEVTPGVIAATTVSVGILEYVERWIHQIGEQACFCETSLGRPSPCSFGLEFWLEALSKWHPDSDEESPAVAGLTIAVAALRHCSRNDIDINEAELSEIWKTIYQAFINPVLQTCWSPARSAQGFLSVPIYSVAKEGQLDELLRLHVWLPDGKRGNPDFAIHSHQPYAQSWILAGEGTDQRFRAERVSELSEATHSEYHLFWNKDGKNLSKSYSARQHSSTILNSGTLIRVTDGGSSLHGRNATYNIPAATLHSSKVSSDTLHATLFYFDSKRGFVHDAPVLGPVNGKSFTQIRGPDAETALSLAEKTELVRSWEQFVEEGQIHAQSAEWEHAQRAFNSALSICESTVGFPNYRRYRGIALGQLGSTNRRFGRYTVAESLLKAACAGLQNSTERAAFSGELGVVYRQMNLLSEAKEAFYQQYTTSKILGSEPEMCRAIGNLGMVNYQLWEKSHDGDLLRLAIEQLQKRIVLCKNIKDSAIANGLKTNSTGQLQWQAEVWAAIGLARLSLCWDARGNSEESFQAAADGLSHAQKTGDPTVIAISQFFYGRSYAMKGETSEALRQFNVNQGCTPAIAFCKEPSEEHHRYLADLVVAGADMDLVDDQGYKALDYAVFNGDKTSVDLVLRGLRTQFAAQETVDGMLLQRQREARLRKGYRELFQEKLRPVLLKGGDDCIQKLRIAYANALAADAEKREMFDSFKAIPFLKFSAFGRLPRSSDGIARGLGHDVEGSDQKQKCVLFFSYRWLNPMKRPDGGMPDDEEHTQYDRMKQAVRDFSESHPRISESDLYIWLVSQRGLFFIILYFR